MIKFLIACAVGLLTGVLTGAGVGGGTLLVLYLTAVQGTPQVAAQGVNLLYFLVSAPAALIGHLKNKLVEVKPGIIAALCGSACALAVALITRNMDEGLLRKAFGVLFLVIGVKEVFVKNRKSNTGL